MIQNGFVLTEKEALENMVTKRIVNRRSKKVVLQPKQLTEDEFISRCREEASNILMGVCWFVIVNFIVKTFVYTFG